MSIRLAANNRQSIEKAEVQFAVLPGAELAARGYVNVNGRKYSAASVASMLA